MIFAQREDQTDVEYARELDNTISELQALRKSLGWERLVGQLEQERKTAFTAMVAARTGDEAIKHSTEYTILTRVLDAPDRAMRMASETLAARPDKSVAALKKR